MKRLIQTVLLLALIALAASPFTITVQAQGTPAPMAEPEPHLQAAKILLNNARAKLMAAPSEFGGHRAAALKLVNQALVEVNQALDYDAANPTAPQTPETGN